MDLKQVLIDTNFNFSETSRLTGISRNIISIKFKQFVNTGQLSKLDLSTNIKYVDKSILEDLYCKKNYNISQLLTHFSISSRQSILSKIKEFNLVNILKDSITKLHKKGFSKSEIAEKLQLPIGDIEYNFKHHSIWREKPVLANISLEEYKHKYYKEKVPMHDLSKYFNTSERTLQTFMSRNSLERRNYAKFVFNYEELDYYYNTLNYTMDEIATIYKCGSHKTIADAIQELGIEKGPKKINSGERKIKDFLDKYNIEYIYGSRNLIKPYEIDFYLPKYNIGIEHDGLFYHSVKRHNNPYNIQNKHSLCKEKGIRLISIFADELLEKQTIIEQRLLHILKLNDQNRIYARKCIIKEINNTEGISFLNRTHIQGSGSNSLYLGSYYLDKLVAVMSFKKDKMLWELNRFSVEGSVIGIASKLLSFFEKNYKWTAIKTYSDPRWNTGDLYKKLGFNKLKDSNSVSYWYVKGETRLARQQFQKNKLLEELGLTESNLTEEELMIEYKGLYRIYGCKQMRFIKYNGQSN
jgi:hypothetical protein